MNREEDYRAKAAASLHRPLRATCIADKGRLLVMAEAWLELADRARKVANRECRLLRITPWSSQSWGTVKHNRNSAS
jgi:hypothetical protein